MWPDLSPPSTPRVWISVSVRQREKHTRTHSVLVCVCEAPQRAAGLCRLATPVRRGQSASNRKCAYKWGSYFYCFCHFTRSTIALILSPSPLLLFSGTSSYSSSLTPPFLLPVVRFPKAQKLAFRSSSALLTKVFQSLQEHVSGILLPWSPQQDSTVFWVGREK